MKPSSFSTICTSNCAFELCGLLLSLSLFHPDEKIYILSDTKTKKYIDDLTPNPKLDIEWFIELDMYDNMNTEQMKVKGLWSDFQMKKAEVIEYLDQILDVYDEMEQEFLEEEQAQEEYAKVKCVLFDALDIYFDNPMAEDVS